MSELLRLNLKVQEVPGTVPSKIMRLQKFLPGSELVRDLYFQLTYGKNLGWKHTYVKSSEELNKYNIVDSGLFFISITKNPYSWLLSLYRKPYHQLLTKSKSFEDFLQREWKTVYRDNVGRSLNNPVELWNLKNKSYLNLDGEKALHITTEKIFEDPSGVIDSISYSFSIEKKSEEFINYNRSTKDKSKDSSFYRDYYLSEKWRRHLSDEAIAFINENVDKTLMAHYGYSVL
jgi:hypothetical protein